MTASNQIYLVMDAGSPMTAFTSKPELQAYLRSRRDMLRNPLIYTFAGDGYSPVIMTVSRALALRDEHHKPTRPRT